MRKFVLFIDDDPDDIEFFRTAFQDNVDNHELHCLNDGSQLFQFLRDKKNDLPALIITDLKMPRFNGKDLLSYLKENDDYCHLPVIIFTTTVSDEQKKILYSLNANCVIIKPDNIDGYRQICGGIKTLWLS